MIELVLVAILGFAAGRWVGWVTAHLMVAQECERLGGFMVRSKTYRCIRVDRANEQANKVTKTGESQ